MEKYIPVMSGDYRKKHYAKGVFHSIREKTAKISFGIYIFFGIVFLGGAYGACWANGRIEQYRLEGQDDMIGAGYVILGVFALLAVIGLACIVITVIRHARGTNKWKEKCAKVSGYTVSDMDEFERQTMDMECRAVKPRHSPGAGKRTVGRHPDEGLYLPGGRAPLDLKDRGSQSRLPGQTDLKGGQHADKQRAQFPHGHALG